MFQKKWMGFVVLSILTCSAAFSAEIQQSKLTALREVTPLKIAQGCKETQTVRERRSRNILGFVQHYFVNVQREVAVDCWALLIKDARVESASAPNGGHLGDVIITGATTHMDVAANWAQLIQGSVNGGLASNITVQLGDLRFMNNDVPLSIVTHNAEDRGDVFLGGIAVQADVVTMPDARTVLTTRMSYDAGLGAQPLTPPQVQQQSQHN